ncbi:MAG: diacylglycerol kinase family lipid kinase [Woeseiaceae bacterium]|nr:diacylglycerol kinase family lipid kinase [Woeseiaceae bacterium]
MPLEPVHVFLNPTAGRGRARRRLTRLQEIMLEAGLETIVHSSQHMKDIEESVHRHVERGLDQVIVAGGDGSIHEAVNGLLRSSRLATLGVIPTGTGNDFAKAADIPLDWETATKLLADRIVAGTAPRRLDVGKMNDRYFANGAGIGLDAKVTALARSYRWPKGDIVYLLAIFRAMFDSLATPRMRIEADGFEWDDALTLASISNGPWIGGMFHIAPMADNADGKLELLIAKPVTRRRIMKLLPKLMNGTHVGEPEIVHAPITQLTIRADGPVPSHLDGEVQPEMDRFDIEILPERLRLI